MGREIGERGRGRRVEEERQMELMTRVCHLCVEQQRSGDALLDKVGGLHTHSHIHIHKQVQVFTLSPTRITPTLTQLHSLTDSYTQPL